MLMEIGEERIWFVWDKIKILVLEKLEKRRKKLPNYNRIAQIALPCLSHWWGRENRGMVPFPFLCLFVIVEGCVKIHLHSEIL